MNTPTLRRWLPLMPLGALAAGLQLPAHADAAPERELPTVKAKAPKEPQGKDGVQATETRIGKGKQELRDVPQSLTVVTEKLIDDRNLETLKDVLRNTAGISFLAAEGGEEDIRLRGFPLAATGDVFVDGLRDPAFYDRDTFFYDRVEVLRGSASMLFGRGSTGGAVNQVTKSARLIDEHQVDFTLGSHHTMRKVGDFNFRLSDSSALRVGTLIAKADDNGTGSAVDKQGLAVNLRTAIGERDEFGFTLYHLNNENGINYGLPWLRSVPPAAAGQPAVLDPATTLLPAAPTTTYGLTSDRNHGQASSATLTHVHRFAPRQELRAVLRVGHYERDLRASVMRFGASTLQPDGRPVIASTLTPSTVLTRGSALKVQALDTAALQSDYSGRLQFAGLQHELQAGVDLAHERKTVEGDLLSVVPAALRAEFSQAVGLTKPNTSVGAPADGAAIDEARRRLFRTSEYRSRAEGFYVQDLVQVAPTLKLLAGLRHDHLVGDYDTLGYTYTGSKGQHGFDKFQATGTTGYRMTVSEWSQRLGALFQPNERASFHVSGATSFNTSGDAYSLSKENQNIPPEQAINLEAGGKIDSEDGRLSTRFALFRSTKLHERNTDPLLTNVVTLSGRRHVAGLELDVAGKIGKDWELFVSTVWMPVATIDVSSATSGEVQGDRPSLTPKFTATAWLTYQWGADWRFGAGLNHRSSQTPLRNPGFEAAAFTTADLMAEYQLVHNRVAIKANVSNLTNKLYADQLYPGHYVPGAGRMVQITTSLKF
ncbi:TonB-dependent receptor [Inhella gelatinilytica]|uniref:TonB-dependent receptor n=1 Tax=Inhella gelatinilytica TaxID=2795030 RepID=A0A931IT50_9BURK|nr:TonB-dependent receptor [Inhella gelatinilytica]MBH9551517.1 TonB-dependent receptor [Inhella gelatinilytica]